MSRIGKQPVAIPAGVDVMIDGQNVSVKGPKGTLQLAISDPITVARNDDGAIVVSRPDDERRSRSLHGLSRTLVSNLVTGVTELVSANAAGTNSGNGVSERPAFTADGTRIVFHTSANSVVAGDTDAMDDLFLWDDGTAVAVPSGTA